jgi:hypothetical protein
LDSYEFGRYLLNKYREVFNDALSNGIAQLREGMESAKYYDHDNPNDEYKKNYGKKNEYFDKPNGIGAPFLQEGITGVSKMYYWNLLNAINEYEDQNGKKLNKGMISANLGVSALSEGDVDGGIAWLLWAEQEDRYWSKDPERSIFKSKLYTQFPEGTYREGVSQFGEEAPWVSLNRIVTEYNACFSDSVKLEDIFRELESSSEHRSLFEGSIWVIHRNLALLKAEKKYRIFGNNNNIYTRLRLFDGMTGLCRFVEFRMKNHEKITGMLGELLITVFKDETWFKKHVGNVSKRAEKPEDFDNKIKEWLMKYGEPERSFLVLWTLRNYATHTCDPDTPFFFEHIEDVLREVLISYIYYLKFRKYI